MRSVYKLLRKKCFVVGKGGPWLLLLALCAALLAISFTHPQHLSDDGNDFLSGFLDNDILSVLGFITAVGNAATLSIFLHLNNLEDRTDAKFVRTKNSLRLSAITLVYVFLIAFFAAILKPAIVTTSTGEAIFNSIGIVCVYVSLSVLRDLTLTVFNIPTVKKIEEIKKSNQGQK